PIDIEHHVLGFGGGGGSRSGLQEGFNVLQVLLQSALAVLERVNVSFEEPEFLTDSLVFFERLDLCSQGLDLFAGLAEAGLRVKEGQQHRPKQYHQQSLCHVSSSTNILATKKTRRPWAPRLWHFLKDAVFCLAAVVYPFNHSRKERAPLREPPRFYPH